MRLTLLLLFTFYSHVFTYRDKHLGSQRCCFTHSRLQFITFQIVWPSGDPICDGGAIRWQLSSDIHGLSETNIAAMTQSALDENTKRIDDGEQCFGCDRRNPIKNWRVICTIRFHQSIYCETRYFQAITPILTFLFTIKHSGTYIVICDIKYCIRVWVAKSLYTSTSHTWSTKGFSAIMLPLCLSFKCLVRKEWQGCWFVLPYWNSL